jgi:hypothetical protein
VYSEEDNMMTISSTPIGNTTWTAIVVPDNTLGGVDLPLNIGNGVKVSLEPVEALSF